MQLMRYFSNRQLAVLRLTCFLFSIFLLYRIAFFVTFAPELSQINFSYFMKGLYLGAKFDMRVAFLTALPFVILSGFKCLDPYHSAVAKRIWLIIYMLATSVYIVFLAADTGYYEYLGDRLSASIFDFAGNLSISLDMVWESYPVVTMLLGYFAWFAFSGWLLKAWVFKPTTQKRRNKRIRWSIATALSFLALLGIYGKFSYYPLRWSEAYFGGGRFTTAFTLNPIHNFFDTYENSEKDYDLEKVRRAYPLISDFLGVENKDIEGLNFTRKQTPASLASISQEKPNIVIVLLESLSAHRSGLHGNPLQATPTLDKMGNEGWAFEHFYTPSEGTARGVFALVTGLTDINKGRTSSRNPALVEQNTAANYFTNYDRYYFIGGSANWGNIRGVLKNNISELKLIEEGMFEAPRTDVWGISDYHLFLEAKKRLLSRESKKPFLAFIQTAGFHRPYSIPEDNGNFVPVKHSDSELKKWGFKHLKEFNSLRFADHSLGVFMKELKKTPHFDNTIFVLLGDHGLPDNNASHLTPTMRKFAMERFHTPLVFYGPKYFSPKRIPTTIGQQDILATLSALTGHEFTNSGLGRNIFDPKFSDKHFTMSYVYYRNPHEIFLFDDKYLVTGTPGSIHELYDYQNPGPEKEISSQMPERFKKMRNLLEGLYQTSKYLLYHNKKPREQGVN